MSTYNPTVSPLKPFNKPSHYFNNNTTSSNNKLRSYEREYSFDSDSKMNLFNTLDIQYWRNKALQAETKFTKLEDKVRKIQELEEKIEVILRHNKHLITQNAQIVGFNSELQTELQRLRHEVATLMTRPRQVEYERMLLSEKLERKSYQHQIEVEKLLTEISKLHEDLFQLEISKNQQIEGIKNEYEKNIYDHIQNLKRSQNGHIDLYEIEIRKLKQTVEMKQNEVEDINRVNKREKQILLEELSSMKYEFKYMLGRKESEIEEIKERAESQIERLVKENYIQIELLNGNHQLQTKKLKKEIGDKLMDLERLNNKIERSTQQNEFLNNQLKEQREKLADQISCLVYQNNEKINEARQKLEKLNKLEIENIAKANQNKIDVLEDQIAKLKELIEVKNRNQEEQTHALALMRINYEEEIKNLESQIKSLQSKLYQVNQNSLQQLQILKVKMAQLHQSNVKSTVDVYEPRINQLSIEVSNKTKIIEDLRTTLHKELQEKLHIRKDCELQISHMRTIIMDLKVKLNAVQVEMAENITSLKSNFESASKSYIFDQEIKKKNIKFYEEETRKLRQAIDDKDDQIKLVQQTSNRKKELSDTEIKRWVDKVNELKIELEEKQSKKSRDIENKESEIQEMKKIVQQTKSECNQIQQSLKRRLTDANTQIQGFQTKTLKLEKDKENLYEKIKKLQHDLALSHGNMQFIRMESEVNLEGEKQRIRVVTKTTEIGLKQYYQRKVKQLQKDKSDLTRINTTQSEQITELVIKYNSLQNNLKDLLESQKKLTEFETKIMNLGLDQNLVKNLAELFKRI